MKELTVQDMNSGQDLLHILTYDDVLVKVDEDSRFYQSVMDMLELGQTYVLHQYTESDEVPDILIVGQVGFSIDEATIWAKELGYL